MKIDLIKALHQECGVSCAELCRRYKQFAARSIYRHATPLPKQVVKTADMPTREDQENLVQEMNAS